MPKIIRANSDLFLFALKYSVSANGTEKELVVENIYKNIDSLDNKDLRGYLKTIELGEVENLSDNDDMWHDFKTNIEKELSVRSKVKIVMDIIRKS